jgi:hypothetical protein
MNVYKICEDRKYDAYVSIKTSLAQSAEKYKWNPEDKFCSPQGNLNDRG